MGAEGAVVARDGARDVGHGHAVDGEGLPFVGRHGAREDEGAQAQGEVVGRRRQGEVVGAREEAGGGEAGEGGHVAHDGVQARRELGREVLVDLGEVAVQVGDLFGLRVGGSARPDGFGHAGRRL